MKFYIKLLLIFIITCGIYCDHIVLERDNELDPKYSGSKRQQITLVEVFVNNNISYSTYALEAAEDLAADDYSGKIVLLEYHIHTNDASADNYSSMAVNMLELMDRYDLVRSEKNPALPDIYVNGKYDSTRENGIQGASNVDIARNRISNVINNELATSFFTIEGSITRSNPVSISVDIARLGKSEARNCRVKAAVVQSYDEDHHNYVVRDLLPEQTLDINNGDIVGKSFQSSTLPDQTDTSRLSGIVWIEDSNAKVLQCAIF